MARKKSMRVCKVGGRKCADFVRYLEDTIIPDTIESRGENSGVVSDFRLAAKMLKGQPFHPPPAVAPPVSAQLAALIAEHPPFDFALTGLGRFPGVLYLTPEPAEPFRLLTQAVAGAFPDYPPYGGKFSEIIPHMTLAELPDPAGLDRIAREFQAECGAHLPLRLRAESVVLMDNLPGDWRVRATFRLGH